ncbi:putative cadmium-transporting ATPase [Waddlia chondrophila 2032/99]|uniref:P-type Zn(2+) transporter n=1 Tax=Waddlia chondrophila 2032/99 TaxID=765953 RepID=F8LCH8_9BACT|nr:putative cadmium-transporting ATPase [Waddlia chondrophila 2032/99]
MLADPKLRWLIFSAFLVAIFEILSLIGIRLEPSEGAFVFGVIILGIGYQVIWDGLKALFTLKFSSINLLMLVAVIGAFYIGEYEEAAVVIVLFSLAERLEYVGISKSKSSLDALVDGMPKYVKIRGLDEPIDVLQVSVGDIIVVNPYALIPLDGEVVGGVSFVDESTMTGESIPVDKRAGDKVFAGTMNKKGGLEIRVSKTTGYRAVDKIREMTFNAIKHKSQTQQFIEQFSSYYTPAILLLALIIAFLPPFFGLRGFEESFKQSLALLVISCPCALVISTPIAIYSAIGNATSAGVLIKGGRYLEAMGQLKAIAFDKTRTLTYGKPVVTDVIPFNGCSREDLLSCAAGVELFSEHPLAQSIVDAAKKEGLTPHKVEEFESVVGKGAKAECLVCPDRHHCVGKLDFILEEHHVPEEVRSELSRLQNEGKTVIIVSSDRQVEGVIAIEDEVRSEAAGVVKALLNFDIKSVMLTGDNELVAKAVSKILKIKQLKSELLPQDKAREVAALVKKHQIVGMVGDGVNDAPALASATVGISMTSLGSDSAIEAANIVILNDHLKMIPYLVRLGREALGLIRFNTTFALVLKFLFVALAIFGMSNLALAIFADVGVTLIVILNSLRLLSFK